MNLAIVGWGGSSTQQRYTEVHLSFFFFSYGTSLRRSSVSFSPALFKCLGFVIAGCTLTRREIVCSASQLLYNLTVIGHVFMRHLGLALEPRRKPLDSLS